MTKAATRNRYNEVPSALLLTEYNANKEAYDNLGKIVKAQRDEIEARLNSGLQVANSTSEAVLTPVTYRSYSVTKMLSAIRKHKLDAAVFLKVINRAIDTLPKEIAETIPYVADVKTRLNVEHK